jgi:DUF1680 family protein
VTGTPAPGGLYHFTKNTNEMPELLLNGNPINYILQDGYVVVKNEWKDNDVIEYKLPMTIKKVTARNELKFNNDRIALQRGPIVYCIEGADNNEKAWNVISPISTDFDAEDFKILDEPVVSLIANLPCIQISNDGFTVSSIMQKVRAIPYYTWSNRGNNAMQVWLPSTIKDFKVNN